VSADALREFIFGSATDRLSPTAATAPDLLFLAVRTGAESLQARIAAFVADPSNAPAVLIRSIRLLHANGIGTAFLERCIEAHGGAASVLAAAPDPSVIAPGREAGLLRLADFDWTFLAARAGPVLRDLAGTAARQAALIDAALENGRALMRTVAEQREEIGQLRPELDDIRREELRPLRDAVERLPATLRNPWIDRGELGNMANFKRLCKEFPLHQFQWGMAYNTYGPEPVSVSHWNRGARIMVQTFVPHGDNPADFTLGTALFTCGTDDPADKEQFRHHYANHTLARESSNINGHRIHIWTRYL
jgi:hypothetical protein